MGKKYIVRPGVGDPSAYSASIHLVNPDGTPLVPAAQGTQLRAPNDPQSTTDPATWDAISGGGTVAQDATTKNLVLTSASGVQQITRRTGAMSLPYGGAFAIRLKRDANLSVLDFVIRTNTYSGPKLYAFNLGVSMVPVGEFFEAVISPSSAPSIPANAAAGDQGKIVGLEIKITPTAGTVTALEIERIRIVEGDPRAGICFQFDDGRLDTYTQAYPILKAAGFPGSIAVEHTAVGAVGAGTASRMTLDNYDEVYANGWALMGHHTAQMTTLTAAQQEAVHQASKDWLYTNDFTRGANHWVWPGGARSITTDKIARKYWATRRGTSALISNAAVVGVCEPYDPSTYYINSVGSTVAGIKARIDQVVRTGGVLVLTFHSLVTSGATAEDWLVSDFQQVVDYAQAQGLKGFTWDQVFDPRQQQRAAQ